MRRYVKQQQQQEIPVTQRSTHTLALEFSLSYEASEGFPMRLSGFRLHRC